MPLIKGDDVPEVRNDYGVTVKAFPLGPGNDILEFLVFRRQMDWEEKWSMQKHKHRDFEEYWYVIKGEGQIVCGDETYDVKGGDLFITPPNTCHKAIGDMTAICITARHNARGYTVGNKIQYEACDEPYRDDPSKLPRPGEYVEFELQDIC